MVQIRTIGGLEEVDRTLMPDGPTTGLVISADGWILSSGFNFVQQPASILVTLASGEQAPATLVAKDHSRMLVLLKLQGTHNLAVPEFAAASDVRVGEWAIAVGRTYRADRTNISVGVISAVRRMLGKAIQTDAHVSVANYGGPLVDIYGKVVGIIVPMSPQATSEVAGAEWYDSGIGFAVPLESIEAAIERMKAGADQFPGLLGVSFARGLAQTSPAEMAAVLPNSPAGMAGFRKGDSIVAIDDQPIASQTDLRFALSPRYAGETIRVKAKRGEEQLERTITLAGKIEPFRHAFLGVLPMRTDAAGKSSEHDDKGGDALKSTDDASGDEKENDAGDAGKSTTDEAKKDSTAAHEGGVTIRMVYPSSPAAEAGIRVGDRLVRIDDADCDSIAEAIAAMNTYAPETKVAIRVLRDGKPLDLTATLGPMPTNMPSELPAAYAAPAPSDGKQPQPANMAKSSKLDVRELKLAEFTETCQVYVPPSHDAGRAAGVILWVHAPGEPPTDELFRQWQAICDRDGLILVAPQAADPTHWERAELEYLRRLIERVVSQYRIDPRRVVVYGQGGGGALGVGACTGEPGNLHRRGHDCGAPLPRTAKVPDNDPAARLAIFAGLAADDNEAALVRSGLKKLTDAGYPVTAVTLENSKGSLSADEREGARPLD